MPERGDEAFCINCSGPIRFCTFGDMGAWEPDYDPANDPVTWRHINGYGGCLSSKFAEPRPEIVVLCGSTRFFDEFQRANYDLTMSGKIVLSVGFYPHSTELAHHGEGVGHDSPEKTQLDELHKRKIDVADRVFVLDVDRYIGESTKSEIEYAVDLGKPIDYLSDMGKVQ